MSESVIRISKKLRGVKHHNTYKRAEQEKNDELIKNATSPLSIAADARKIKHLEDRIYLLETELQKAREESFQAGYDEGKQRTLLDAQNRIEAVRLEMKQQEINFRETIEQMEKPLLDLAKVMAKEVIHKEIQSSDETDFILLERLRKMLAEVVEQNNIIIEVNPQQLNLLKKENINAELGLDDKTDLKIIGKKDLLPGEVKIETEDYFVDGSFSNHVDKIHDSLDTGKDS